MGVQVVAGRGTRATYITLKRSKKISAMREDEGFRFLRCCYRIYMETCTHPTNRMQGCGENPQRAAW